MQVLCIFVAGLILAAPANASHDQTPRFSHLQIEDGLSQATVNCIAQDSLGFIWFGTQEGLNRYDGHNFRIFTTGPNNPASLGSSFIESLYVDRSGRLWIGTDLGLARYNPRTETFTNYYPPDAGGAEENATRFMTVTEDDNGCLWLGANGDGLYRFDPRTGDFVAFHHEPDDPTSLASNIVNAVCWTGRGMLWVGTDRALQVFDTVANKFRRVSSGGDESPATETVVLAIRRNPRGGVWVGTKAGLDLHARTGRLVRQFRASPSVPGGLPAGAINSLYITRRGQLWVGTANSGVALLHPDQQHFTVLQHQRADRKSLADNRTMTIFEDRAGVIWVGTYSHGVDYYDRFSALFAAHHSVPELAGAANDYVRALIIDRRGDLWVGTDGLGAARHDHLTGQVTHYLPIPGDTSSLGSKQVFSFCEDHNGTLWLGGGQGTLYEYLPDQDAFRSRRLALPAAINPVTKTIRVIHETKSGSLLLGTDGDGALVFEPHTGQTTPFQAGGKAPAHLINSRIFSIISDHDGNTWFGVFGSGLLKIDGQTGAQTHYHHVPGKTDELSSGQVMPLIEDSTGTIWIGTNGGGLDKLDPATGHFTHYRAAAGLPNNAIYAILEDEDGYLWLSHNRGLTRFDPVNISCRNYSQADGLQSNEFNGCAAYKSADGELFFGGINGFNRFYPADIRTRSYRPPVVITDLRLGNQSAPIGPRADGTRVLPCAVSQAPAITLYPHDHIVSLEYAAMAFGAADKINYAYRMLGLEKEWNEAGHRRFATYNNLAPGQYTFEVRAADAGGNWPEQGTSLSITVRPAFWQTAWFRTLVGSFLLGLFWALYRYRTRLMRFRAEILEKKVRERTLALECEIAERTAVQRELAAAHEKAVKATAAKSTFLATMSHEIRTPMNGIFGMTQLLLDSPTLSPEDRDQAQTIHSSGEALLTIINDILDFSKIEAGKMEIEEMPFDLKTAVAEIAELLAAKAAGKGLELIYRIPPNTPLDLVGDAGRIRQIVLNLVGNAIKFTAVGHVAIDIDRTADGVRVSVQDTGIGLTPEQKEKLFQPFSQADSSTTRRFGGTGLGLAISRQLVELMGGVIGCDSVADSGSTFWFTLPLVAAPTSAAPDSPRLEGACVVAVCSDERSRLVLAEQIAGWGATPVTVAKVDEVRTTLADDPQAGLNPELVLYSCAPNSSETDYTQDVQTLRAIAASTPILFLTPASLPIYEDNLAQSGLAGALAKPVRPDALLRAAVLLTMPNAGSPLPFITRRSLARLQSKEVPAAETEVPDSAPDSPWRVLVAEDNTVNQRVAKRMLEKAGCTVDLAANGEEAVAMWRKFQYDVVFMDCRMPEMDGYTATGEIRTREAKDRHTPIVAMTANVMEGDRQRCLDSGMDDYLPKPLRMDDCHRTLRKWAKAPARQAPEIASV